MTMLMVCCHFFKLSVKKFIARMCRQYCCHQRLSWDAFASDLAVSRLRSDLNALRDMPVDDLAQLYRDVMTDLLNRHYPVVTV